ncbi:MAG: tyrosine-type recombinase/integrase [Candidatus Rariloculaceae bacterium]
MLTQASIKALKPSERQYKASDSGGLYLLVTPKGARYWRYKYRYQGVEKLLALGVWPRQTLKEARALRDDARRLLDRGLDPSAERRAERQVSTETFEVFAREWLARQKSRLAPSTYSRNKQTLELLFTKLGKRSVTAIQPPDLLQAIRTIEARGAHETAKRCCQIANRIFRYAISIGKTSRNPAADLSGALIPPIVKHRSAITEPRAFGALLRTIDAYGGEPSTRAALQLLALLFTRPSELRLARWSEFDLDAGSWVVPAERMKMRREHLVPLSDAAVIILRDLGEITSGQDLVFPGLRPSRPISENTMNYALRNMGISPDQHTAHGFRSSASTLLHELGYPPEVIELQLAHTIRNPVAAAYNRSTRLDERRKMMQAWADYLEGLRDSDNVVTLKRQKPA